MSDQRHPSRAGRPDDFVYHLYRASSLLLHDDVGSAKVELEQALRLQPEDPKGQDLLASTYFRLGLYPRAIALWGQLASNYPDSPTLHVNLGLALFKTGQVEQAESHLEQALRLKPSHARAWRYLGLVRWRQGKLEEAKHAFERGGHPRMVERMQSAMKMAGAAEVAPIEQPDDGELEAQDRAAMRNAAEEAILRLESAHPNLMVELSREDQRSTGSWISTEPGREVTSLQGPPRPRVLSHPPSLHQCLAMWSWKLELGVELAISEEGALLIQIGETDVFSRLSGLAIVRGELHTAMVQRSTRGSEGGVLGDANPIMRWQGPVSAVLHPRPGMRFVAINLAEDDVLYVREARLFAFSGGTKTQSAKLPLGDGVAMVAQLAGRGCVVLQVPSLSIRVADSSALRHRDLRETSSLLSVPVAEGETVYADPTQLVGWSGRLFPRAKRGTAPYSLLAPELAFKGEGSLLILNPGVQEVAPRNGRES